MYETLTPVRSLDRDRQSAHESIDLRRLTPAERLTHRLGVWLVERSRSRLEHAPRVPKRTGDYAQDQRERVLAQAHRLGTLRSIV